MKVCIKENEFNPSLLSQSWCTEEKAIELGYTIVEAPEDCVAEDFVNLKFNKTKYNNRKNNETNIVSLKNELQELLSWFDEYDNQIKQYLRCQRTNTEFDKNIEELDAQAKINSARITEIRNTLGDN